MSLHEQPFFVVVRELFKKLYRAPRTSSSACYYLFRTIDAMKHHRPQTGCCCRLPAGSGPGGMERQFPKSSIWLRNSLCGSPPPLPPICKEYYAHDKMGCASCFLFPSRMDKQRKTKSRLWTRILPPWKRKTRATGNRLPVVWLVSKQYNTRFTCTIHIAFKTSA